jgi:glycosyltransferase involved in cell wall biosynthesis
VIVGRLDSFGDYASGTDHSSRTLASDLIANMADRVVHHERMAGPQVLGLLARADYYVFPTLADTFGYSALEAMANGAVVITTNVRAMAEVIDDEVGFSISLPLDLNRETHSRPDFPAIKAQLVDQLEGTLLRAIRLAPCDRQRKAEAAIARLRIRHDPSAHGAAIDRVYRNALGLPAPTK